MRSTFDLKTRTLVIAVTVGALCFVAYWAFTGYQARTKYEQLRADDSSIDFHPSPMTESSRSRMNDIRSAWELRRSSIWTRDERELLNQAGYSDDVAGVVALWSAKMPPFSLFDQERNKLWIGRAAYRNLFFPERLPYWHAYGILFCANDRYAVILEDTPDGLSYSAYTPKKTIIEQGSGGDP